MNGGFELRGKRRADSEEKAPGRAPAACRGGGYGRDGVHLSLGDHAIGLCGRLARLTGSASSPFPSLFGRRRARSSNSRCRFARETACPKEFELPGGAAAEPLLHALRQAFPEASRLPGAPRGNVRRCAYWGSRAPATTPRPRSTTPPRGSCRTWSRRRFPSTKPT